MHYLSNLLIILHYNSILIVYEPCGSMVIYPQSPQDNCVVGCCISWQQVLSIKFRTAVTAPQNLIIGLDHCALKLMNLNVQNIKQSALLFCFTSDILKLRNVLTLQLK